MRISKKIGLALGSGGAKGFAHLGALRAFEEENIEFDLVAGTSIGSIVGGLYAKGFSSRDMLALLEENTIDPQNMLLVTIGVITLPEIISKFTGGATFNDLKKPFSAIAVDMQKGEEVVINSGDLALAMACSSAIPPFRPVLYKGKMLVDGAYLNYVPADVVKNMGADIVISINLGKGKDTNQGIKRTLDELYPNNKISLTNRSRQCYEYSDIIIEPDLSSYSSASVNKMDEIYDIGYRAVKEKMSEILCILRK